VGVIGFPVVGLPGQILRLGLSQSRQGHAVGEVARSGRELHDQLCVRLLYHVAFMALKPFLRGLAAEAAVRVWRGAVHVVVVVIAIPVLLFQTKQVHLGGHVGGINDVQPV
jgi:hypothetical protein